MGSIVFALAINNQDKTAFSAMPPV